MTSDPSLIQELSKALRRSMPAPVRRQAKIARPMKPWQQLLHKFDEAAQEWGYMSDSGTGDGVKRSKAKYERTKRELVKRIQAMEVAR